MVNRRTDDFMRRSSLNVSLERVRGRKRKKARMERTLRASESLRVLALSAKRLRIARTAVPCRMRIRHNNMPRTQTGRSLPSVVSDGPDACQGIRTLKTASTRRQRVQVLQGAPRIEE